MHIIGGCLTNCRPAGHRDCRVIPNSIPVGRKTATFVVDCQRRSAYIFFEITERFSMTVDDIRKILKDKCDEVGSQAAFSYLYNISPGYISDTLTGRREPGPALLAALGIRRIVSYQWDS